MAAIRRTKRTARPWMSRAERLWLIPGKLLDVETVQGADRRCVAEISLRLWRRRVPDSAVQFGGRDDVVPCRFPRQGRGTARPDTRESARAAPIARGGEDVDVAVSGEESDPQPYLERESGQRCRRGGRRCDQNGHQKHA